MIDVHPAPHAAHSWREFLTHIATIVLGIIIAIGLEQIVELVHHHGERVRLEAALRNESLLNRRIVAFNTDSVAQVRRNIRPRGVMRESSLVACLIAPPSSVTVIVRNL